MRRMEIQPRTDWQTKVEQLGFSFHTAPAGRLYWNESACYAFSAAEVDELEAATNTLHDLCLQAAGFVIEGGKLGSIGVPPQYHPWITHSWNERQPSVYGRFDLAYSGDGTPKMLEYNADTPTSLLEAAVVQWQWLEETRPKADQFNSIHERLIAAFKIQRARTSSACFT